VIASAPDLGVVRAVGVESEIELAFAVLHPLCVPILDRLDRLPGPQRVALELTFGLSEGPVPDRFLVGLALLGSWPRPRRTALSSAWRMTRSDWTQPRRGRWLL
jgi:hypothetical protein